MELISSGEITNDFRKKILLHFKQTCEKDITTEWPPKTTKPLDPSKYFLYKLTALLCLTRYPNPEENLDVLPLLKSLQLDLGRLTVRKKDPGYFVQIVGLKPNSYKTLVEDLNYALDELDDKERKYDKKVGKYSFFLNICFFFCL